MAGPLTGCPAPVECSMLNHSAQGAALEHRSLNLSVERFPGVSDLRRHALAETGLQADQESGPNRFVVGCLHAIASMLTAEMRQDGSEHLRSLDGSDDAGQHVHELQLEGREVIAEQAARFGSDLEQRLVEAVGETAATQDDVGRAADALDLIGCHGTVAADGSLPRLGRLLRLQRQESYRRAACVLLSINEGRT